MLKKLYILVPHTIIIYAIRPFHERKYTILVFLTFLEIYVLKLTELMPFKSW